MSRGPMTTPAMDRAELRARCARLPPMQTLRRLAGPLALVVLVAACTGTAAPSGSTASGAPPTSTPPGGSGSAAPSVEPPATDDPDAPVGTEVPHGPSDNPNDPPLTIAKPGQLDLHQVRMDRLAAVTDGRRVVVTTTWTSGVEPCNVLDHVLVERGDGSFTITLFEGHGPGNDICIEIAQIKQTQIDLGDLAPGTYTIADGAGGAAPIEVTVG